jgi:hypothetical protein
MKGRNVLDVMQGLCVVVDQGMEPDVILVGISFWVCQK